MIHLYRINCHKDALEALVANGVMRHFEIKPGFQCRSGMFTGWCRNQFVFGVTLSRDPRQSFVTWCEVEKDDERPMAMLATCELHGLTDPDAANPETTVLDQGGLNSVN
jgi:hypothetical protein